MCGQVYIVMGSWCWSVAVMVRLQSSGALSEMTECDMAMVTLITGTGDMVNCGEMGLLVVVRRVVLSRSS